jgi:cell division septation protein DedD
MTMSEPFDEDNPRPGRRGRARYATASADQRVSRPLVIAVVGVVAVAAFMFWPRGGGQHLGNDAPVQVVRVDAPVAMPDPKSGEVDIATARQPLVAEPPGQDRTTDRERPLTITSRVAPAEVAPPPPRDAAPETTTTPPAPIVPPAADGAYALQVASFASEAPALSLRDDLTAKGYPVHVRAASKATGAIVYRVWVGYFPDRDTAAAFAAAHREELADATPVHR